MAPSTARPYAPDVHGLLIATAARGELVFYSDLER
jgi:hypothetical protein